MTKHFSIFLCLPLFLGGCMVHQPESDRPPLVSAPPQYNQPEISDLAPAMAQTTWWATFDDPALSALVEQAFQSNLSLRQLVARIEQARARWRQAGGRLLPSLDATGDYDNRWIDADKAEQSGFQREETASVGLLLDWELDVWGRLRSARTASRLEVVATEEDWLGGRLLLSVAVVETYFEILEQRGQLGLLAEQLEVNTTLLQLTLLRFGQGQSSIVDVLQQKEQLASTRTLVPVIQARLEALHYSLFVWGGGAPGPHDRTESTTIQPPPPLPAVGIPSQLLETRPDLQALQARLEAIDYRVGEAMANRLPRFNIGGDLIASGTPSLDTFAARLLAGAVGPVFDAGIRKAEIKYRQAQLEETVAEYSEAFLLAVQDVETALVAERQQTERVKRLADQLDIGQRLLNETRNRYSQGLTDYLPVLAAVVTVQNLQRELLTSRREQLSFRIALHRALGGPMGTPPPARTASIQP